MKKNAYRKDIIRTIGHSRKRFFSIMLICVLGVTMFSGLTAACKDLQRSADQFFDDANLHDIRIVSTMGLTNEDLAALEGLSDVSSAAGVYGVTGTAVSEAEVSLDVTMQTMAEDGTDALTVLEGTLPAAAGEAAVTSKFLDEIGLQVGDTFTVTEDEQESPVTIDLSEDDLDLDMDLEEDSADSEEEDSDQKEDNAGVKEDSVLEKNSSDSEEADSNLAKDSSDSEEADADSERNDALALEQDDPDPVLNTHTYRITARVLDPTSVNNPNGSVSYRDASANSYTVYITEDNVTKDSDTVYMAALLHIEGAKNLLCYADTYKTKAAKVRRDIEDQIAPAREQQRLQDIRTKAQESLDDARQEADDKLSSAKEKLDDASGQLEDARKELEENEQKVNEEQETLDEQRRKLKYTRAYLPEDQRNSIEQQMTQGQQTLDDAKEQLEAARAELEENEQKFSEGESKYNNAKTKVETALSDAQQQIDDLKAPSWYVQDRGSMSGYANIGSDADSIQAIADVFPVVFFIVAILISLTTVTRMVDEERGLIGTYKALGFHDNEILQKYLVYSITASLAGSMVGSILAFVGLPSFIFTIFRTMYLLPYYHMFFDPGMGIAGPLIFILGIAAATAIACRGELRQTPAALMRPRAPKPGMRTFLERTPLWKRLSFLNKVTARNLFRYNGRMLMTIFGVAGCMALLLFGFGIQDSVHDLMPRQYEQTCYYDMMAVTTSDDNQKLLQYADDPAITSYINCEITTATITYTGTDTESSTSGASHSDSADTLQSENVSNSKADQNSQNDDQLSHNGDQSSHTADRAGHDKISANSEELSLTLIVFPDYEDLPYQQANLKQYISTRDLDGREMTLDDDDVFVTQNAGNVLGFSNGDTIHLQLADLSSADIPNVTLTQNYLGNYIYMRKATYEKYFGTYEANGILCNLDKTGVVSDPVAWCEAFGQKEGIVSGVSTQKLADSFSTTFALINVVVYIIILMSAALAFVVLFTLQTTNISERERELATIKVLGFYDHEVHQYVNKESLLLTFFGVILGIPLGYAFAQTLTTILNLPSIYLAVSLHGISYLYAAGLSLGFAVLVDLITNRVLNRIDPVTALKSVE